MLVSLSDRHIIMIVCVFRFIFRHSLLRILFVTLVCSVVLMGLNNFRTVQTTYSKIAGSVIVHESPKKQFISIVDNVFALGIDRCAARIFK